MLELKMSGYNAGDRYQILCSGFRNYDKLRAKEDKGLRPFYRNNKYERSKRQQEKIKNKKKS